MLNRISKSGRSARAVSLAVLFFVGMWLALLGGCATPTSTRGQVASAAGIAGIAADNKTALELNQGIASNANPTGQALAQQQKSVLTDQAGHITETSKASDQQANETDGWKKRALTAENNTAAASRLRYDIFAGLLVLVAIAATALRVYAPPVEAAGGTALQRLTVACAVAAAGFVVASILSGAVASAMIYVGPAFGVAIVVVTVFWCIAHRRAWSAQVKTSTNIVKSVSTALASIPVDAADTAKKVMADIQTPDTQAAVASIKAALPVKITGQAQ